MANLDAQILWSPLPMVKVAVIILNFNGLKYLQTYLSGVVSNAPEAEIVVADNGSTDGSLIWLTQDPLFSTVKVIDLGTNLGFSGGYNQAIAHCPYEFVVLLNSDVETPAGWLQPMVNLLDTHPEIAACQPKILSIADKSSFEFAGACGGYIDRYGYPFCRGRLFETCEHDNGQYDNPVQIFWATGACLLIRTADYLSVGGLDEFFFAHMEEIDLCWRLAHKQRQVWVVPSAKVYHVGGGTLHKSNPHKTYLNFRNGLLLLFKNLPPDQVFSVLYLRLTLDSVAGFKFFLNGQFKDIWAILKAHYAFYMALGHYRPIRRMIKPSSNALNYTGIYQKSIVFQYFIKGAKHFSQLTGW